MDSSDLQRLKSTHLKGLAQILYVIGIEREAWVGSSDT